MHRCVLIFMIAILACHTLLARQAKLAPPPWPGTDAHWPSAAKNGFGTSTSLQSKVWFTLANGVMTEVFYPTLDSPNTQSLRLIFCKPQVCVDEERGTTHTLKVLDQRALTFQQTNSLNDLSITKTYTTDVDRSTVLIEISSQLNDSNTSVFVAYDPSLKNSGMHDTGWTADDALLATDGNVASALVASNGFESTANVFATGNQLARPDSWLGQQRAKNGNVVQFGKLRTPRKVTLALSFAPTPGEALTSARRSLRKGFSVCRREYEAGWHAYLSSLLRFKSLDAAQIDMAAMVLKGLEDKTYRGAFIASPSTPWGGGPNANEPTVSGYHAVWSRDLYQVATALFALGDYAAANRALDFLFKVQQKPDGSFPQNSWVDGRAIGGGLQMDQVGLALVLAYQLGRNDRETWVKNIKPAAEFIVSRGPVTNQDRWEEKSGYSPGTIAAQIAGLVCAASVARKHGDNESSTRYLKTADKWKNDLTSWTVTTNGSLGDGNYFLRLTENGKPNDDVEMEINSGGGKYDQRSIVDAGFLELVRLGVMNPGDPLIRKSLEVIDSTIKVETKFGPGWYRYNHDAYGERPDEKPYDGRSGIGRLWTLLTGERGEYEVALGRQAQGSAMLNTMARFANAGRMIPEQVWDRGEKIGSGTGSATPLAWSMAQFVRLAVNIQRGRNLETPQIVAGRYAKTSGSKNH